MYSCSRRYDQIVEPEWPLYPSKGTNCTRVDEANAPRSKTSFFSAILGMGSPRNLGIGQAHMVDSVNSGTSVGVTWFTYRLFWCDIGEAL